jgi:hypothetical protein
LKQGGSVLYPAYPEAIAQKYGFVRRARFCYLYTQSGRRLTDLYQEAGRAILGWRGGASMTAFKNAFSRGVTGSFFSEEARRLKKAVQMLIPGTVSARWYTGETAADFLRRHTLWRPWDAGAEPVDGGAFVLLPPFPPARDVLILASRGNPEPDDAPPSDVLPPCLLAGIARSIYDVIAEIPLRGEAGWSAYDGAVLRFWDRRGPYLYPTVSRENYAEFALDCLGAGLVISPDFDIPSIIPWNANKGDFSLLCGMT